MSTQNDAVNLWRSATDRPNILVVAPADAPYAAVAQGMKGGDAPCEVVCVDALDDALRLLRRGNIAVVVIGQRPAGPGSVELILEGFAKERPPRFIVVTEGGGLLSADESLAIRKVSSNPATLRNAILGSAADFERAKRNLPVRALFDAVAGFPDSVWLKICNTEGEFGDLCIDEGRAVYCELGPLSGATAAARISKWGECLFELKELPSFLQKNLDCPLGDLLRLSPGSEGVVAVTPVSAPQVEPERGASDPDEPTDFPTLDSLHVPGPEPAVPPVPAQAADTADSMGEPEEPSFDPQMSDEEIHVEEPLEMTMQEDELRDLAADPADVEEPELLDFIRTAWGKPEELTPPAEESLFSAVAVIAEGSSHLESCRPEMEAMLFDTLGLREMFDLAVRCARRQQIGEPNAIEIRTDSGVLVLAPIKGSGRLLAVRLRGSHFGGMEEMELQRLREAQQLTCPAGAV